MKTVRRFRKVSTSLWQEPTFRNLVPPPPNAHSLLFYALTGPRTTACPGLLNLGELGLAEELRWPADAVKPQLQALEAAGWVAVDLEARVLWLRDALAMNQPDSPNHVQAWGRAFAEIPPCAIRDQAIGEIARYLEALGAEFEAAFRMALPFSLPSQDGSWEPSREPTRDGSVKPSPPQEQEQEQEQEQDTGGVRGGVCPSQSQDGGNEVQTWRPPRGLTGPALTVVETWRRLMREMGRDPHFDTRRDLPAVREMLAQHSEADVLAVVEFALTRYGTRYMRENNRYDLAVIARVYNELDALRRADL